MAEAHGGEAHPFVWWNLLHNDFLNEHPHVAAAAISAGVLILGSLAYTIVAPRLNEKTADDQAFIPPAKLGIRNLFELPGELVQGLARDIIGHHYKNYLPLLIYIFLWTLVNNVIGILPGMASATDNLNTTLAMGLTVFVYYNFQGFRTHGFRYLEQFTGHLHGTLLLLLGPVMFVIETISHCVRPVTLGMRLRANIYADHTVHGIIMELLIKLGEALTKAFGPVGAFIGHVIATVGPIPIVLLGLLVCVIQAFVFTLLTSIYVGLATAHDEH